jgi:hypothetical protein
MTLKIEQYGRQIRQLGEAQYPETQALLKVPGVGHLTALTFVLTLGSKERFKQSRDVGCYLGFRPRRSQSGDRDPQLRITKAGNVYLRSLLIECAGVSFALTARTHSCDSGACTWPPEAASKPGTRLLLPLRVSWPCCSITAGPHNSPTCPSTQQPPEI